MSIKHVTNEMCKERVSNMTAEIIEVKETIKEIKADRKEDMKLIKSKLNKIIGNDLTHVNTSLALLKVKVDSLFKKVSDISDSRKANLALLGNLITIILLLVQHFIGG